MIDTPHLNLIRGNILNGNEIGEKFKQASAPQLYLEINGPLH
jgi:hypothetical protein